MKKQPLWQPYAWFIFTGLMCWAAWSSGQNSTLEYVFGGLALGVTSQAFIIRRYHNHVAEALRIADESNRDLAAVLDAAARADAEMGERE